jgi:uncharacterized protein (TIGR03437 family)
VASTAPRQAGLEAPVLPVRNPLSKNRFEAKHLSAPLSFEPNQGQTDSAVQFLTRGTGYALFLTPGQIVLNLERQQPKSAAAAGHAPQAGSVDTLRMSLMGADPQANAEGLDRQPGVVSYFIGNDPKKWRSGIPTYGKVEYPQVYPGVDLVFYGNQRQLEYDFVVAAGADPSRIAWRIDGARPSVDAAGNSVLHAPNGPATFRRPVVYQMDGDRKTRVEGWYAVAGNEIRFRVGRYDHSQVLMIDPVLSYATYLAGSSTDYIGNTTGPGNGQGSTQGIAVDSSGSAYVTGYTYSSDFPSKNGYQGSLPSKAGQWPSAYVTKFSPDGTSLVYSTYLGGNGTEEAFGIAVDINGEAYVTGMTNSVNFPTTAGAYQTVCDPLASNLPPPYPAGCNSGNSSAFVTKLNATGTGLVYSTFLSGNATGIAVDSAGRAYVAGWEAQNCQTSYTYQACFPITSGAVIGGSLTTGGSPQYGYVSVFDPTGAKLLYSTMYGDLNGLACNSGCGPTFATGVTVDANGDFYLIGHTHAGKLPTTSGVVQPTTLLDPANNNSPAWRGFIAKFNPVASAAGASLAWGTYLGGHTSNTSDYLSGITVDGAGNVYVTGYTNSVDFPVTSGVYGTACGSGGGCAAAHVTKLNSTATSILWSTYVGGARQDGGDNLSDVGPIQLDSKGNVYITAISNPNFPLVNPVESPGSGGSPGQVVFELDPTGANLLFATGVGSGQLDAMTTGGLAIDASGNLYVAGNNLGRDLITTPGAFETTNPASNPNCCTHGFVAKIAPTTAPQITVRRSSVDVFNAATFQTGGIAPNEFITLKGTGLGPATGVSSAMTTQLAGSSVSIGGTAAYLTYAQDGQVNVLVPFGVSGLQNTTIEVQFNGVKGNTVTIPVAASSPGIFTQAYGPGQAWMVNQDGTFNSASNPALRNTYVAFWLTGQGLVNTTLTDGTQPPGPSYPAPMLPVSVSLGGVAVPAANLAFDGLVYSGEVQINLLIPANAPTGNAVPLVVTIGAASSRSDATIAIK